VPELALDDDGSRLVVSIGDIDIATYEYLPDAPSAEAPKPFLHPLKSTSGAPLSIARPWDHRWHKGLQMTWSHISDQNFWGGPSFTPDAGYIWKDNLGRIQHIDFSRTDASGDRVIIEENLKWITSDDRTWLTETRAHTFHHADVARGIWVLDFATSLLNVTGQDLRLGSPTTHGRPEAGYTGLFWRGPRSWTDGEIIAAAGAGGETLMGSVAEWAAITGQHDEIDGGGTVLMFAGTSSATVPIRWFSRSQPFACLAPSAAFDTEIVLAPGERLNLSHRVVFVDRICDRSELGRLATEFRP
jgi:hypothetical protein